MDRIDSPAPLRPNGHMAHDMQRGGWIASALALLLASGCGPEVSSEVSGATTGSGGAAGAGGQGGSGGGQGGSGGGVIAEGPCAIGTPPTVSELCGPPEGPCVVLADEIVPGEPQEHGDAPPLGLDADCNARMMLPDVLDSPGKYARRSAGGQWTMNPTLFYIERGGIGMRLDGEPLVLIDDGYTNTSIRDRREDGIWWWIQSLGEWSKTWTAAFAQDDAGTLHVAYESGEYEAVTNLMLGAYSLDGSFTATPIKKGFSHRVALSLSPAARPHVAYHIYHEKPGHYQLYWHSPPATPEAILPEGVHYTSDLQMLAVTEPDAENPEGKPHVLTDRRFEDGSRDLVYATRKGPGAWEVVPVAKPLNEYDELVPLGIVTEPGGGVRLFHMQDSTIHVSWVEPGPKITTAAVVGPAHATGSSVRRDGLGRIHLAFYEGDEYNPQSHVRYLLLGQ